MKNFLHGMGGGVGRGIGKCIGYLIVAFCIYLLINLLHVDIKNDLVNKILFLDVNARTIEADVTNSLSIPTEYSGCTQSNGYFWGDDGSSSICHTHAVKSTISGVLYSMEMVLKNAWLTNQMAFVNITGMSSDFRNNNLYCTITNSSGNSLPCTLSFNSKSSLTISFVPNVTGNYTLGIYSSTYDVITGINTYGIRKVVITQNQGDNSDVIDSANQNSQNEINNANQNAQNIIDNQNQNTQNIIDNQNAINDTYCKNGPIDYDVTTYNYTRGYINSSGTITDNASYYSSPYLLIKPNTQYVINVGQTRNVPYFCWYFANKGVQSCTAYNNTRQFTVTSPSTAVYLRVTSIMSGNSFIPVKITGPICNNWEQDNANRQYESTNETNDLIKDDSVDQSQANNFFSNFNDDNHGLSSIITLPLQTIQSLTSSQCVQLHLPIPFTNNQYLDLPCMSQVYQNNIPDIYAMWQVVCYGLIGYWIATDVFRLVKGLKDPDNDKIEVLDL